MLLAMASDMRVVLVRLASRLTTLRLFCRKQAAGRTQRKIRARDLRVVCAAGQSAGRLAIEVGAGRPVLPLHGAGLLQAHRSHAGRKAPGARSFVANAIARLKSELAAAGIKAEVYGRPKHIYSIWSKMRGKSLDFSELYDVRAFRVIVEDVRDCYTVLGIVHNIWTPIPKEFDDYISRPKPNGYQSLHTVVVGEDGRALEVQVRTAEMHHFAEYGVAAHWRYKESGGSASTAQKYDEKIAWLRQLLAWKSEVVDAMWSARKKASSSGWKTQVGHTG
jgi:GTP pyrophosphokinase